MVGFGPERWADAAAPRSSSNFGWTFEAVRVDASLAEGSNKNYKMINNGQTLNLTTTTSSSLEPVFELGQPNGCPRKRQTLPPVFHCNLCEPNLRIHAWRIPY